MLKSLRREKKMSAECLDTTLMTGVPWWNTPLCSTTPQRFRPMLLIWMGSLIKLLLRQIKVSKTSLLICLDADLNKNDSGYKQSNIPVRLTQYCTELATINDNPNAPNATSSGAVLHAFKYMKG